MLISLILVHISWIFLFLQYKYGEVFSKRVITEENRKIIILPGQSLNSVLTLLEKQELAPSPLWVKVAMNLKKKTFLIKRGKYNLHPEMSCWEILEYLDAGQVEQTSLTLCEGLEKWECASVLGKTNWGTTEEFSELINSPRLIRDIDPSAEDLEGYLFPETYSFEAETTPEKIIETLVGQFRFEILPHLPRAKEIGLTLRQWVTLASMVEKETAVPEERARIAGVFMNRRRKGIPFQCDPTIVYGLKKEGKYRGKIYRSDLKFQSPYNTYIVQSLPPGPIASPGWDSLMAVLNYEIHDYYFFVSKNDGTHYFSKTLGEHNKFVRKYQR